MTEAILLILAAWGGDIAVAHGYRIGIGGPCTYHQLRSGRFVGVFPQPCNIVQLGYMRRSSRNTLYDATGRVIGYRTAP